jgi:hypothetical protein
MWPRLWSQTQNIYVRSEVFTAVTMKNAVFWDIKPQFIPHMRHIMSPLQIWGFHGGDYEEWHLQGYKNPVSTSQETHYVSVTEPSQLMLCRIWGFLGGDWDVTPCDTRIGALGTLANRNTLRRKDSCDPDDGGDIFLRNVGSYKSHTPSHPRRRYSTKYFALKEAPQQNACV